ncbi:zinc ABC transporter substrate-binding protein [Aliiroseovarius sp. YM-037]|uniref:zinc ABC transporter substrate-binding protein n=1 Tax=Aliiroseovarius sp. YM-037 TaxID=3341728 RepID=UPI003A7F97F3
MLKLMRCAVALTVLSAGNVLAEPPTVTTDILPVHSLVAAVMEGVAEPSVIISSGATPHDYSMRPSDAGLLQDAEVVFWVGHDLTPWLGDSIGSLAPDARIVELLEHEGTATLSFREGAQFGAHGHDDDHGHDHEGDDPHAWLDPANGQAWLRLIAEVLAETDPENAIQYAANADAAIAKIDAVVADAEAQISEVRGRNYVVFHDAFQYFETRFDIEASGAISIGDAETPSAARIAEITALIDEKDIACVFAEPQFNSALVTTVFGEADAKAAIIDPLGSTLQTGPTLYPNLIRDTAGSLADCLR